MLSKTSFFLFAALLITGFAKAQSFVGAGKAVDPFHFESRKNKTYANGAVVCAHPIAAKVGAQILKRGGNAIDAVIATQLALAVVYPGAGNLGGGGFLIARMKDGKTISLDYRETAPAKASRDMYLDSTGKAMTDLSQDGHLSSGVPGTVSGLFATHKYA